MKIQSSETKNENTNTREINLLHLRPRLKRGTIVLSLSDSLVEGNRVFIGCNGSGIQCEALGIRTIIAAFDGKKNAQEIAEALAIDCEIVSQVVGQLLSAGLIDYLVTQIVAPGRFKEQDQSADAGYIQLQSKITPELSATTWIKVSMMVELKYLLNADQRSLKSLAKTELLHSFTEFC